MNLEIDHFYEREAGGMFEVLSVYALQAIKYYKVYISVYNFYA